MRSDGLTALAAYRVIGCNVRVYLHRFEMKCTRSVSQFNNLAQPFGEFFLTYSVPPISVMEYGLTTVVEQQCSLYYGRSACVWLGWTFVSLNRANVGNIMLCKWMQFILCITSPLSQAVNTICQFYNMIMNGLHWWETAYFIQQGQNDQKRQQRQ